MHEIANDAPGIVTPPGRSSDDRFRLLVEAVDDYGIVMLDLAGNVVSWNAGAEKISGYRASEVVGRPVSRFSTAGDAAAGKPQRGLEIARSEGRFEEEGLRPRKGGSAFWARITITKIHDSRGHLVGFAKVFRDITEQRRLVGERDALLTRLQLHIRRMPLAYILFDAALQIRDWNPAAERIFGYSRDAMLGHGPPYARIVPESVRPELEAVLRRIRAGDMHVNWLCENRTESGRTITCDWFFTPIIDDGGAFAGFIGLAQDVTEQKSLQAQFYQSQKMEAVGQLAGGLAHDFNNLLTIISGHSELLLGKLAADDPLAGDVRAIDEAGGRAAGLTRQLLAFSRRAVLDTKVLELNAVVRETETMLGRLIGEDIQFATVLDPTIGRIRADPGQIGQVLINLAVNARDAMPRGGSITVETSDVVRTESDSVRYSGRPAGRYVQLAVRDNGRGMTPEIRDRIFEPFFTTKLPGKGTGLGLATVYGIVEQSGGSIEVETEPGRGTSFRIYLPVVDEPLPPAPHEWPAATVAGGSETVLFVDDDDAVRAIAVIALKARGYNVLHAESGARALDLVAAHRGRVDLLVTDVVMLGLNGRELAEKLVAQFPKLRVLYQSGYTDDSIGRHGVLPAEVAFLQKPYTPTSLARKVREMLDK